MAPSFCLPRTWCAVVPLYSEVLRQAVPFVMLGAELAFVKGSERGCLSASFVTVTPLLQTFTHRCICLSHCEKTCLIFLKLLCYGTVSSPLESWVLCPSVQLTIKWVITCRSANVFFFSLSTSFHQERSCSQGCLVSHQPFTKSHTVLDLGELVS